VISGRSRKDVGARVSQARVKYVIGNHGLEPGRNIASFEREVTAATPELERKLEGLRGVEIENKRYSLAIHYRKARGKRVARAAIEAAVRELDQRMRMIAGKLLVNVVPEGAPHKGDALAALRAREGADTALYVGDDITDEDVFEIDQPGRLLGVRVGRASRSAAAYFLRDQREIDTLLSKLRALRARGRS
jgi:trehalose 6-phosphate phosphatase